MARDPDRPDLRRAWRRASEHRARTGDGSDDVLMRFLTLEGIDLPQGPARDAVLGSWRRRHSFRAFQRVALGVMGRGLVEVGKAYRAIYQSFRGPASPRLVFEATDPEALLRLSAQWEADEYATALRLTEVELSGPAIDRWFEVVLDGRAIGKARPEEDSSTPSSGPGTLYVDVEGGRLDPDNCWIDQD